MADVPLFSPEVLGLETPFTKLREFSTELLQILEIN